MRVLLIYENHTPYSSSSATVGDSDITLNDIGIFVGLGSSLELNNVQVKNNTGTGIGLMQNSSAVILGDSNITHNGIHGIFIESHSFVQVYEVTINNNGLHPPDVDHSEITLRRDAGLVLDGGYVNEGSGDAIVCDDSESSYLRNDPARVDGVVWNCTGFSPDSE